MKNEIKNAFIGMKTKLLSLLVALCVTTALWSQNNVITYTATEKLTTASLCIGSNIFGYGISSHTFANGIGTITCYGDITTIGSWAFDECSALTSITIPNSVTKIGYDAFDGCSGLKKTNYTGTIADWCKILFESKYANPMSYSNNLFINDVEVKDVVIPEGVDKIGYYTFLNCSGLTSITIPNSVTTIGSFAFWNCSSLTSVTIGNSVTTIGTGAFWDCSSLTLINIPSSVTTIGAGPFSGCTSLPVIDNVRYADTYLVGAVDTTLSTHTIKEGTRWIDDSAFRNCTGLTSITIPNSVTTIGNDAFSGCSGLTSVTLGYSVTTIGVRAFEDCSNLISVTINSDTIIRGGMSYKFGAQVKEYIIGDSVTKIGQKAFYECDSLTSVTIGNSVTTIGDYAFYNCTNLTSITIPSSVTTIGNYAFWACSSLTSITIPNSVTTIGSDAFAYCGLTSVTIPNSVTTIGSYTFQGCDYLKSVIIPNSVTTIGEYAFYYCTNLTSITIPSSVTTIGEGAFYRDYYGVEVIMESTTPPTYNGDPYYLQNWTIHVPCNTTSAYQAAWGTDLYFIEPDPNYQLNVNAEANGSIEIVTPLTCSNDVATISAIPDDGYHFTQWSDGSIDNPRSIGVTQDTTIEALFAKNYSGQCGDNLYWQYSNETLNITGSGAMYDGQPWFLFRDSITKISLPTELTTIGDSAFAGLSQLNNITIPAMVTTIGAAAFAYSLWHGDIYCLATEPPVAQESSFDFGSSYTCLYVLCDNLHKYETDAVFGLFWVITCIEAEEKPIEGDQVVITPSTDNVTFTWPQNDQAAGYSIEITKDGIVFCTLTFNAQGQLTGIAFAPNRAGSRMLDAAVMTSNGWQFTVTGLDQACKYGYTIDALNASKQSIKHYEGEFVTDGYTSLEWVISDKIQGVNKMLLDGHLYILRDGNLFTATGARVK